jgi:hypothetical protein
MGSLLIKPYSQWLSDAASIELSPKTLPFTFGIKPKTCTCTVLTKEWLVKVTFVCLKFYLANILARTLYFKLSKNYNIIVQKGENGKKN